MYNLSKASSKVSEVNKPLVQRMKEYWGEMLAQIKDLDSVKDDRETRKTTSAPSGHKFYSHQYCGNLCYKKKAIERGEVNKPSAYRPFYSKQTNNEMLNQIQ